MTRSAVPAFQNVFHDLHLYPNPGPGAMVRPAAGQTGMIRIMKTLTVMLGLALTAPPVLAGEAAGLPHAFEAGWHGQKTCELLFEDPRVRVARCVFPPGVGHEKHYHNPHYGYVLEGGTLRIVDAAGERTVTTESGGSWSTDAVTVHEAVNIGETTTSYLVVEPVPR
jgi:quercetin dioxygenase-like cupin family protein